MHIYMYIHMYIYIYVYIYIYIYTYVLRSSSCLGGSPKCRVSLCLSMCHLSWLIYQLLYTYTYDPIVSWLAPRVFLCISLRVSRYASYLDGPEGKTHVIRDKRDPCSPVDPCIQQSPQHQTLHRRFPPKRSPYCHWWYVGTQDFLSHIKCRDNQNIRSLNIPNPAENMVRA